MSNRSERRQIAQHTLKMCERLPKSKWMFYLPEEMKDHLFWPV